MIRKLLLPTAAALLLGGCVTTAPYGYRGGDRGDYYYGQPSVDYRYHGVYPGYGSSYYGPYRSGIYGSYGRGWYGYPSGYGYRGQPYYRGWYGHPGYPPVYRQPRRDTRPDTRPDGGPWRSIDELRRRRDPGSTGVIPAPTQVEPRAVIQPRPVVQPRERGERGSAMGEMIRRSREGRPPSSAQEE
jgi:hypothetical protein